MESTNRESEIQTQASSSLLSRGPMNKAKPPLPQYHFKTYAGKWKIFTGLVLLSAAAIFVALNLWAGLAGIKNKVVVNFSAQKIGGSFSLSEAKAIDVASSVLVVPCLISALNYVWFTSARVSAVNELQSPGKRGVPLAALIEASTTTCGSYDIFRIIALLRGRTWRLLLLALLVLLSAIARSALSNIIAYEAFHFNATHTGDIPLRYLSDTYLNAIATNYSSTGIDFGSSQAQILAQVENLFTDVTVASSVRNNSYIGVNATTACMESISPEITELHGVPGFRLTVNCTNEPPTKTEDDPDYLGVGENLDPFSFAIFEDNGSTNDTTQFSLSAFLGFVTDKSFPTQTPYGDLAVGTTKVPLSQSGVNPLQDRYRRPYYGIRCSLYRSDGQLDYARNGSNDWNLTNFNFSDEQTKIPSFLAQWQGIDYRAPGATNDGIGPVLSGSANTSWSALAQNFLYASGEVQRIGYEFAASNSSRNKPDFFYSVSGIKTEQRYRITYVPFLLLVGLVAALAAAGITAAMALYTARTLSARTFRQVDPLRLILDCGQGLQEAIQDLAASAPPSLPNDRLEKWAQGLVVTYAEVAENGELAVRLRPNYTKEE
ncbi:hypothetical protein HDK64DRAFT_306229 [Phyllosticta capitalensis]